MKCKYTSLFSKSTAPSNACIVSFYGARTQLGTCICRKGVSLHSCQGAAGWEKRKPTGLRQNPVCPILTQAGKHHGIQFPGKRSNLLQVCREVPENSLTLAFPKVRYRHTSGEQTSLSSAQGLKEGIGKVLLWEGQDAVLL